MSTSIKFWYFSVIYRYIFYILFYFLIINLIVRLARTISSILLRYRLISLFPLCSFHRPLFLPHFPQFSISSHLSFPCRRAAISFPHLINQWYRGANLSTLYCTKIFLNSRIINEITGDVKYKAHISKYKFHNYFSKFLAFYHLLVTLLRTIFKD